MFSSLNNASHGCEFCRFSKQTRLPFSSSVTQTSRPFELVHSDLWGPAALESHDGFKYFVIFVDDYSRATRLYLLKSKGEVLRTDNGTKFVNSSMTQYLSFYGIMHQTSCVGTPQQNGIAERKNHDLLEETRLIYLIYGSSVVCVMFMFKLQNMTNLILELLSVLLLVIPQLKRTSEKNPQGEQLSDSIPLPLIETDLFPCSSNDIPDENFFPEHNDEHRAESPNGVQTEINDYHLWWKTSQSTPQSAKNCLTLPFPSVFLKFRYEHYCSSPPKFQNSSSSHLLLFIAPVFGLPSPPPATPSDDMDIKRTSTLSSTTLTSQPLPTVVWITGKSKKLAGFDPKSPLLVRVIPSTIFFDPGMIFQPLELFLLLVVLVRRNF
ncbi:unnamed protein product [Prunus armeniaca]